VQDVLGTAPRRPGRRHQQRLRAVSDATRNAVATLTGTINALLADLNAQVLNISASDTLLDVGLVESSQQVTRKAGTVTSQVSNKLVGVDLLGGLVTVERHRVQALASLGNVARLRRRRQRDRPRAKVGDLVSLEVADTLAPSSAAPVGQALPPTS
jgi:hypothetical protein